MRNSCFSNKYVISGSIALGALCVTTLITDHNHAPIDESNAGNGGVDRPIKKWKFEMSDADEGEENKFNPGGENNPGKCLGRTK